MEACTIPLASPDNEIQHILMMSVNNLGISKDPCFPNGHLSHSNERQQGHHHSSHKGTWPEEQQPIGKLLQLMPVYCAGTIWSIFFQDRHMLGTHAPATSCAICKRITKQQAVLQYWQCMCKAVNQFGWTTAASATYFLMKGQSGPENCLK